METERKERGGRNTGAEVKCLLVISDSLRGEAEEKHDAGFLHHCGESYLAPQLLVTTFRTFAQLLLCFPAFPPSHRARWHGCLMCRQTCWAQVQ